MHAGRSWNAPAAGSAGWPRTSFADMAGRHESGSVVHETYLRLAQALETTEPDSVEHFFRLAARKVRHVLLDMVERHRRLRRHEALGDGSRGGQTHDPERLALWTVFHEKVATLPDDERAVFEMHYYLELPQAEITGLLSLPPRQVSRLWIRSTDKLAEGWRPSIEGRGTISTIFASACPKARVEPHGVTGGRSD